MNANGQGLYGKKARPEGWSCGTCRYGLVLMLTLVGILLLRPGFTPDLQHPMSFPGCSILIALSAGLGGLGPGRLAAALSALWPADSLPGTQTHGAVISLLIAACLLGLIIEALRRWVSVIEAKAASRQAEVLREGEWRFHTLADTMPLLIWQCDANAKCDTFNQRWLQFTGRTMAQEVGDGWTQDVHPDDALQVRDVFLGAFARRDAFRLEYRLRHHSGEYRWILDTGAPRFGPNGQFLGYIGGCIDITDRKRAEEALQRSEERLSLAMDFAGAGMWDADLATGTAVCSPQHFTLLGYQPAPDGRLTVEQWRKRVHPDDQERVLAEYKNALKQHRDYRDEYRIVRADDGQVRWVSALGRCLYDEHGRGVRFVGQCFDVTERKRAETALSESEGRLKLAQQAGHVGVFDWDMISNRAVWTAELDEVFGLTPNTEEGVYESWVKYVHPEDLLRLSEAFQQCIQEQRVQIDNEYRILRPDGQVRWVEVKGHVSYRDDGRPTRIVGTIADLNERHIMEEALRESEAKFRVLAENARASFGIVQGQRFVYANPYFAQISGYSVEELLTMDFPQLVHPDSLPMMLERARRRYSGEIDPGHYDFAMRTKSGEKRWVEFSVASIEYQGQPGMIGTGFDVTERKRAEQALREYAEGLDFLSGAATRMLGAMSRLELYRFVAERIYSLADGAVVTFSEFDVRSRQTILREVWSTPEEREMMIQLLGRKPEGLAFDFLEETREWIVPGGLALVEGGLHELTFRQLPVALCKQLEKALNIGDIFAMACAFEEDLLGLVALATHELSPLRHKKLIESLVNQAALALKRKRAEEDLRQANERLTSANAALADADRRKDEFLAMLAHELRNPLAPVRNAVQVLRLTGPPHPQMDRQRDIIDRQVNHMGRLLDDLLDASRITRGKITLQRAVVDLRAIAEQVLDSLLPVIEGRGQHLRHERPNSALLIDGDPTRLEQILRNLIQNAIKYTEPGGCIWVVVGLDEGSEQGWQAVVRVLDSGIGIAPEVLPRVFDLFAQADQSLARSQGGLGIGLTMVKRLVELHGGRVEAHSRGLGQGSEFIVRLPLAEDAMGRRPVAAEPAAPAGLETPAHARRVLVVDDNEDAAASLGELLGLWGHEVYTANDGLRALKVAREWRPEVILLDIGLPGMDGYEVARRLRQEPETAQVWMVALTGYGAEEDRRRALDAGFDHHLVKPVSLDQLSGMLAPRAA